MNILLIMTDQQRYDSLGCYGNENIDTKNIDSLAQDGILFENAYSTCPACIPARGSLLTGLNQYNLGSMTYGANLQKNYNITIPKLLKKNGYYTIAVGKNHFNPQRNLHGYDEVYLDESNRIESEDFVSDYMAWFEEKVGHRDIIPSYMDFNGYNGESYIYDEDLHPTNWVKNLALEKLKMLFSTNDKWFLKISFARPHSPYDAPKRLFDKYMNKDLPMPISSQWGMKYSKVKGGSVKWQGKSTVIENRKTRAGYFGNIELIDEAVGEILNLLKTTNHYDDTMIIFTSDHGDMLGDHNLWRKTYAYEGSSHIPLLIKLPNNYDMSHTHKKTPATLYDILPTIMARVDSKKLEGIDGIDLVEDTREYVHGEYILGYDKKMDMQFISDGRYKFIWYMRTGKCQLFNLENDIYEQNDLANKKQYEILVKDYSKKIAYEMDKRGIKIKINKSGYLGRYFCGLPYNKYGALKKNI